MKQTSIAAMLFGGVLIAHAQSGPMGVFQAEVQPNVIWTMELRPEGATLKGSVSAERGSVEIREGVTDGRTVAFTVESPDGDRTITLRGAVNGDSIAFVRQVQVRQGGGVGGSGIFDSGGVREFTMTRVPAGSAPKVARGAAFPRQLVVYDRQGKLVRQFPQLGNYNYLALSPDGTKVACTLRGDVWVFDVALGTQTRITSTSRTEFSPVWSRDGSEVMYSTFYQDRSTVYRTVLGGAFREELVYEHTPGVGVTLTDWSADGRLVAFDTGGVISTLSVTERERAKELAREEFRMSGARFAPGARFLAFRSEEAGRPEVFVVPFDPASGLSRDETKLQISRDGSLGLIQWRRDGRELLYLGTDGQIMAASVSGAPKVIGDTPQVLFKVPDTFSLIGTPGTLGSISADGERVALALSIPPPHPEKTISPAILSKYTGIYELFGADLKIVIEREQLVSLAFGERIPLSAKSDTSFFSKLFPGEIEFASNEHGDVTHLLFYQGGVPVKAPRK